MHKKYKHFNMTHDIFDLDFPALSPMRPTLHAGTPDRFSVVFSIPKDFFFFFLIVLLLTVSSLESLHEKV